MKVSIIVPAYNRARTIEKTLRSLSSLAMPSGSYEIIVMDNNSTDGTGDVVRGMEEKSEVPIRYFVEERQGVHYARNRGAMLAKGEVLYYTDDDMVADPEMMGELLRALEFDPRVATAGGRVLPCWECEPPPWIRRLCENGWLSLQLRPEELIISPDDIGIYSCHQIIRKSVLLECGGFNPENTRGVWVGDGETGLNLKIRARGYRFAYTANAITHHIIPPERMTQRYLNRRMENQGHSDAFTWFRSNRSDDALLAREEVQCNVARVRAFVRMGVEFLRGREQWRMARASLNYFKARSKYVARLRRDAEWRAFVLRDNWMDAE